MFRYNLDSYHIVNKHWKIYQQSNLWSEWFANWPFCRIFDETLWVNKNMLQMWFWQLQSMNHQIYNLTDLLFVCWWTAWFTFINKPWNCGGGKIVLSCYMICGLVSLHIYSVRMWEKLGLDKAVFGSLLTGKFAVKPTCGQTSGQLATGILNRSRKDHTCILQPESKLNPNPIDCWKCSIE